MYIIGIYPEFWARWSNLFFWPLIIQFCFFLIEVGFLFFGYYLTWDKWANRKRLHIFMGIMAAFFGLPSWSASVALPLRSLYCAICLSLSSGRFGPAARAVPAQNKVIVIRAASTMNVL